ncbi:MAG: glucose-6-phosphate isomerase [Oscillospiraceae bacterium]
MPIKLNDKFLGGFVADEAAAPLIQSMKDACRSLKARDGAGNDYLGWLDLPKVSDRAEFLRIKDAAKRIREMSDVLVVIGIGGSYLGSRAVIELLGSQYFNDFSPLKIYFAGNNISGDYLNNILKLCEGKRVCVNVVSKSGTTTESAIAFRVFKNLLETRYGKKEAASRIFATTDKALGTLKKLAEKEGYECFVIPDDVGGRYSVLTAVGLLPIASAGFDIDKLVEGAEAASEEYDNDSSNNPCNRYALLRNLLYSKGKKVEILASFEPSFAMMNEWYKQLFGESEGKDKKGILPTSVIFSMDLHSMGQYIQDGQRMIFETFVKFASPKSDYCVAKESEDFDGLNYLADCEMSYINDQAMNGTLLAHCEGGVPCLIIEVDRVDEYNLGELIFFFERACAVSGYMLGVNPFNQPGVESYKKNMFALLGKHGYEQEREALLKKIN